MAVIPPFSIFYIPSTAIVNYKIHATKHAISVCCLLSLLFLGITSTAKTNDCTLLGAGGCRGEGWDNGPWPLLLTQAKSLGECCTECTETKGCTSFHLGRLQKEKGGRGDCFLFAHTAISPVKSLGGECYKVLKGKGTPKKDEDDDDDDGPTEEQCKRFLNKACEREAKNKEAPLHHKTTENSGEPVKDNKNIRRHPRTRGSSRHDSDEKSTESIPKRNLSRISKLSKKGNNVSQSQDGIEVFDDGPEIVALNFSLLNKNVPNVQPKYATDGKTHKLKKHKDASKKETSQVIRSVKPTADRRSNLKVKNKNGGGIPSSIENRKKVKEDVGLKKRQQKKDDDKKKRNKENVERKVSKKETPGRERNNDAEDKEDDDDDDAKSPSKKDTKKHDSKGSKKEKVKDSEIKSNEKVPDKKKNDDKEKKNNIKEKADKKDNLKHKHEGKKQDGQIKEVKLEKESKSHDKETDTDVKDKSTASVKEARTVKVSKHQELPEPKDEIGKANAKEKTSQEVKKGAAKESKTKPGLEKDPSTDKAKSKPKKEPSETKSPSPKPKARNKLAIGPKTYDGKYLKQIGVGGCRGKNWDKMNCPKDVGRRTLDACAVECRKSDFCTAFHILKPDKDQTFDCLLFSHQDVIAVKGLGGVCYTFSKKPPGQDDEDEAGLDDMDDEEEDDDVEYTGPIIPLPLGEGFCRGPKWTFKKWPVGKGRLTTQGCAEECAKTKGCNAFDISTEYKEKYDCCLYGHKAVVPTTGISKLPARCYVLQGSPLANLLDEDDLTQPEDDEHEDQTDFLDVGEVGFTLLGEGMCRGQKWQSRKWPKSKGIKTLKECAAACLIKEGCRSFDMSPPDSRYPDAGEHQMWCNLYSHKDSKPAAGVPGYCYKIHKDASELTDIPEDEEMLIDDDIISPEEVDDSLLNSIPQEGKGFRNLGKGLCRGQNWQDDNKIWPKDDGMETFDDCLKECKKDKGCTAFDVSPIPNSIKFRCLLFGHDDVRPASALSGRCIRMTGRQALPSRSKQASEEGSEDFVNLGKGLCRGPNWQTIGGKWPIDRGMKSIRECYEECHNTGRCTAFDIRDRNEKKKYHCFLFGHSEVSPASSLAGTCYKMTGPISPTVSSDDEHTEDETDSAGIRKVGKGACRGPGWQEASSKWPAELGSKSVSECGQACFSTQGCTAFDVRMPDDNNAKTQPSKFICTIYGHTNVIPASGVPADCYSVPTKGYKQTLQKPKNDIANKKAKPPKAYKIPEFETPKVLQDDEVVSDDDDEWLFDPPPPEIRSRAHIDEILDLEAPSNVKVEDTHLKGLKKIYENSVKPLETIYKYKELSHRHFGDPEIFNKPLVVLMGPWSGGKSTMINYLLGTEYTKNAFRAAAEPSPGFNFNIAMYGEHDEELDGTELAAEWTFSSLQKFGQEFLKKLRGKKFPNKLLHKATFAEIPGVLETGSKRKVDRLYPFNEACQWFIDHADLILLVYDYTKLDIGPETEALLDQLKGRESQVRIILNKADAITAEELLKIQGNLVWNVSPLMSSLEPPAIYAGSFWSRPYKEQAPKNLLKAQESSLLKDIRDAIDKRVENRIATARRFAVRVRNHAKMVDCYLTTFNNKKGMFGNKKKIVDDIVENPEKYHIYEGISSMTNISRYDLPDPDTYKTFFGLHPLLEFTTLQSTCTFFKGCPVNKLDKAIAYELPEALTAYKRSVTGTVLGQNSGENSYPK